MGTAGMAGCRDFLITGHVLSGKAGREMSQKPSIQGNRKQHGSAGHALDRLLHCRC